MLECLTSMPEGLSTVNKTKGARDMAQQLRALTALAEDTGLVPNTHVAHNNCP